MKITDGVMIRNDDMIASRVDIRTARELHLRWFNIRSGSFTFIQPLPLYETALQFEMSDLSSKSITDNVHEMNSKCE